MEQENRVGELRTEKKNTIMKKQQYPVYGKMIERSQVWLNEKKRREAERREEALLHDLDHCTFSPALPARKTSQLYLKTKSKTKTSHTPSRDSEQASKNIS